MKLKIYRADFLIKELDHWYIMPTLGMILEIDGGYYTVVRLVSKGKNFDTLRVDVEKVK